MMIKIISKLHILKFSKKIRIKIKTQKQLITEIILNTYKVRDITLNH